MKVVLIIWHIQCSHLMNSEAVCVSVSLGTHVQPQITLDLDHLPDYLSVTSHITDVNSVAISVILVPWCMF